MRKKTFVEELHEPHIDFSDISDFFINTIPGSIILVLGMFAAGVFGIYKLADKGFEKFESNTTYGISEATILAKLSQQDVSGNGYTVFTKPIETKCDYEFVLDIDNDGVYDKNKDIIIEGEKIPFVIAKENNKAVLFEQKDKLGEVKVRKLIGIVDKNNKCNVVGDIPSDKYREKNESYQKAKQLFEDNYLNQR
ncbi:MAG: hypothetical protein J6J27_01535 [Alphaproteobacteria bacterium]|nr:hypothetical protein [Alphaproteobacteria bacterium]